MPRKTVNNGPINNKPRKPKAFQPLFLETHQTRPNEPGIRAAGSNGRDLCISTSSPMNGRDSRSDHHRKIQPSPDHFEFSSQGATAPEMCCADEIFARGRMIPSNPTPPALRRNHSNATAVSRERHRRSESVDGIDRFRRRDYWQLRRAASDSSPVVARAVKPKPKWYWFLFGSVRMPEPAMEISEIRSRIRRRGGVQAGELEGSRWAPWKLIRSLSCKGVESAAAMAPEPMPLVSHGLI